MSQLPTPEETPTKTNPTHKDETDYIDAHERITLQQLMHDVGFCRRGLPTGTGSGYTTEEDEHHPTEHQLPQEIVMMLILNITDTGPLVTELTKISDTLSGIGWALTHTIEENRNFVWLYIEGWFTETPDILDILQGGTLPPDEAMIYLDPLKAFKGGPAITFMLDTSWDYATHSGLSWTTEDLWHDAMIRDKKTPKTDMIRVDKLADFMDECFREYAVTEEENARKSRKTDEE